MSRVTDKILSLQGKIETTAVRFGRDPASIRLLGVTKKQPLERVRAALEAGLSDLGESYLQEAITRIEALSGVASGVVWHFIGRIQANKTAGIATHFDWVHTVDRLRVAQRLSDQRSPHAAPLELCLQVNLHSDPGRAGVAPESLPELAEAVAALPRVELRGLMCLPPYEQHVDRQRVHFAHLRCLREELNSRGFELDTLSMGMSHDMEAAIAEGATILRIGTALFGRRPE